MADCEVTREKIDRLLLRLVKRLKAYNDRVSAAEDTINPDYWYVELENVIFDFLGLPAETVKFEGEPGSFCRDGFGWKLDEAKTDTEIIAVFDLCREYATRSPAEGWVASDEWTAFDDFMWGSPAPFEREVESALQAGAELAHGMTRDNVLSAEIEARHRRRTERAE